MTARDQAGRGWGPLLFLGALTLYALTTSRYAVPELSASVLAQQLRLVPFPPMNHPLWSWIIRALAAGGATPVLVLNLFSAVCGAAAVWMLYALIAGMNADQDVRRHAPHLGPVSGLAAALYLATCIPFWLVSNRAHPAAFDLMLLLGALLLLRAFVRTRRERYLYLFAALYAAGVIESATLILFAPALALYLLLNLWRRRALRPRLLLAWVGCGLLGPLLLVVAASDYARLPAAHWREFTSIGEVLWYYLLELRFALLSSLPRQGWLLLFMASLLPWLLGVIAMRRRRAWDAAPGTLVLYLVVTALAVVILFNGPVAPWTVMGTSPLLVMPYVFIASYFGFMVARWGELTVLRRMRVRKPAPPIAVLLAIPVAALVVAAAVRNAPAVSTRAAPAVHTLAQAVLDHLSGRDVLLTQGLLGPHLLLEARARGQPLALLDASTADLPAYGRYMSSLFDSPRRQSLALVGLGPMIVDWLRAGDDVAHRLAIEVTPDLWLSEGYEPVPLGTLYLGERARDELDPDQVVQISEAFWVQALRVQAELTNGTPGVRRLAAGWYQHLSQVANDTGVFLENVGRADEAIHAYDRAMALQSDNLSAALNLIVLARSRGVTSELAGAESLLAQARTNSIIRSPLAAAARGGHLRLKEAADLLWTEPPTPSSTDPALQEAVTAYLRGDRAGARRRVEQLLAGSPQREEAWLLLATLAYEQGDNEAVQRCVRQMRNLGREWPALLVIMGRLALDRDDTASAREYFERAAALQPGNQSVQEILLRLDLQARDFRRAESRLRRLLAIQPDSVAANHALAKLMLHERHFDLAEDALRRVLRERPDADTLADLAWLRQHAGDYTAALELATQAVEADAHSYAARDVRGLVLMKLLRRDEARQELERASALNSADKSAQVHLIQLLAQGDERDEAQRRARQMLDGGGELTEEQRDDLQALLGPR